MDYISGAYIENIEKFEDDYEFMKQVIDYTNDKKMYNLCSTKLKNDYLFTRFLVNKFSNDSNFITLVARNYLDNNHDEDIESYELIILLNKYLTQSNSENFIYFKMKLLAIKIIVEGTLSAIKKELNQEISQEIGLGFYLIFEAYKTSEIVTDYFATEYLNKIFYNDSQNFEELIHTQVKDYSQIEKQGINNFLINYINKYDPYLASYISIRTTLLDKIKEDLAFTIDNWQKYLSKNSLEKNLIFQMEVKKFVEEELNIHNFIDEISVMIYLCEKLKLEQTKEFFDLDSYLECDDETYKDMYILSKDELSIITQNKLKQLELKIKKLYEQEKIDRNCDDYNQTKTKVIYASNIFNKDPKKKTLKIK